jgi:hypothetical protein
MCDVAVGIVSFLYKQTLFTYLYATYIVLTCWNCKYLGGPKKFWNLKKNYLNYIQVSNLYK